MGSNSLAQLRRFLPGVSKKTLKPFHRGVVACLNEERVVVHERFDESKKERDTDAQPLG